MSRLHRTSIILLALALLAGSTPTYAAPTTPQDADVAGNWTLKVETPEGEEPNDLVFVQEGKTITGTVGTPQGPQSLKGTVEGNNIAFLISVDTPNGPFSVEFVGTVQGGNKISGTISSTDGQFSAPFTCEKKEGQP
jgi:hypothetical protein